MICLIKMISLIKWLTMDAWIMAANNNVQLKNTKP